MHYSVKQNDSFGDSIKKEKVTFLIIHGVSQGWQNLGGGGRGTPSDFGIYLNHVGVDYAHNITTHPLKFLDLLPSLNHDSWTQSIEESLPRLTRLLSLVFTKVMVTLDKICNDSDEN